LLKAFPRQRDQRIKERRNFAAMHECGGVLVFGRRQRRDTPQAQLAGVQKERWQALSVPVCSIGTRLDCHRTNGTSASTRVTARPKG
jgi:hypothetical protein